MSSPRLTDEELTQQFGRRLHPGAIALFLPGEFGYHCPQGHTADALAWSEFNDHLWCYCCNQDFHYAKDCYVIRPEWMSEASWQDHWSGLPEKPELRPGTIWGIW